MIYADAGTRQQAPAHAKGPRRFAPCPLLPRTLAARRWVRTPAYKAVLVFESWAPEVDDMRAAVDWALAQQAAGRPVFVHCTHGHGRSAVTACAILCAMGQAEGPDEALAKAVQVRCQRLGGAAQRGAGGAGRWAGRQGLVR